MVTSHWLCFILITADGVFGAMMKVILVCTLLNTYLSATYFSENFYLMFYSDDVKVNLVNDGPVTLQLESPQTSK